MKRKRKSKRKDPFDTESSHVIWISFLIILVLAIFLYIYVLPSGNKVTEGMKTPTPVPYQHR